MFTAFSTALSGLDAMSSAIDVVGNNLANMNTVGYKNQTVSFQDLVAESLSGAQSTQLGLGTSQPITSAQFVQGSIQTTAGSFDGAINGAGFFVVKNTEGQNLYTRAGNFQVDKNGYLTTQTGEYVQGWLANGNGVVNPSGAVSDIQVPIGQALSAVPTTTINATVNLDSSTAQGAPWATGALNIYDSLGNSVPLSISFVNPAPTIPAVVLPPGAATQWNYTVTGTGVTAQGAPIIPATTPPTFGPATGTLSFNTAGKLVDINGNPFGPLNNSIPLTLTNFTDGSATNQPITWNLNGTGNVPTVTQFSEASDLTASTNDGQPAAVLTGVSLQNGGMVMATYSNGASQQVAAQLALASIRNPQSFMDIGNNNFALGTNSATPTIGASGAGGLGAIDGGSVESSTVDIATEFSDLLTYERSYQADSRVVTVSDTLAQDAVNLIK